MDNPVENNDQGIVLDDAAQAQDDQPQGESLAEITEDAPQQEEPAAAPAKEPGWIKGRIEKAVAKAVREAESRVSAQYEAMLAPIRESVLERQAEELVRSGEFKTLDIAKEYVRMKNGAAPSAQPQAEAHPQENAAPDGRSAAAKVKADMLLQQANKIRANRGIDVIEVFNTNPDVKQKVLSGEWDFYDVADAMGNPRRAPLSPVRSPNGGGVNAVSIQNMTDEQFKRLQANLATGRKYDMRK